MIKYNQCSLFFFTQASNGWLQSFLKRNEFVSGSTTGESGGVNQATVDEWLASLPTLCAGYNPEDIFNCDETALFYRNLKLQRAYHDKNVELRGFKQSKERVSIMMCASMTGEKCTPLLIGKAGNPRCFKNIDPKQLPVTYRHNKKAWMTRDLFTEWLNKFNAKMKRERRKVLLFLDNASSHPNSKLSNVQLAFLPPNTTSRIQPLDQGILETFKKLFRKRLLAFIAKEMGKDAHITGPDVLKRINLLDTIYWIKAAWQEVTPLTIAKCFDKCGFKKIREQPTTDEEDPEDDLPLALLTLSDQLFGGHDAATLAAVDDVEGADAPSAPARDWEQPIANIISELNGDTNDQEEDDESEQSTDQQPQPVPTFAAVDAHLEALITYATHTGNAAFMEHVMALKDLNAAIAVEKPKKQSKISDFFNA